jgi:uncharacterized protein YqjF (DUF2071 family)
MIAGAVECMIERRLLVNYRIEPQYVARLLPPPLRPQLVSGRAVGGVCLIRLGGIRTARLPRLPGLTTENAAHRFAVEWDGSTGTQVGVYVPRRDTSSRLTAAAGGTVFPGSYQLARFTVDEPGGEIRIAISSRDGRMRLAVAAAPAGDLASQLFATLDDAVGFFRRGALGFSPSATGCLDGVRLHSASWAAAPMTIERISSSLFDDPALFPSGSCSLDSALVMRDVPARWAVDQVPQAQPSPAMLSRTAPRPATAFPAHRASQPRGR